MSSAAGLRGSSERVNGCCLLVEREVREVLLERDRERRRRGRAARARRPRRPSACRPRPRRAAARRRPSARCAAGRSGSRRSRPRGRPVSSTRPPPARQDERDRAVAVRRSTPTSNPSGPQAEGAARRGPSRRSGRAPGRRRACSVPWWPADAVERRGRRRTSSGPRPRRATAPAAARGRRRSPARRAPPRASSRTRGDEARGSGSQADAPQRRVEAEGRERRAATRATAGRASALMPGAARGRGPPRARGAAGARTGRPATFDGEPSTVSMKSAPLAVHVVAAGLVERLAGRGVPAQLRLAHRREAHDAALDRRSARRRRSTRHTPVTTSCARPASRRSIATASCSSARLAEDVAVEQHLGVGREHGQRLARGPPRGALARASRSTAAAAVLAGAQRLVLVRHDDAERHAELAQDARAARRRGGEDEAGLQGV